VCGRLSLLNRLQNLRLPQQLDLLVLLLKLLLENVEGIESYYKSSIASHS
jgi:hypothetical protein